MICENPRSTQRPEHSHRPSERLLQSALKKLLLILSLVSCAIALPTWAAEAAAYFDFAPPSGTSQYRLAARPANPLRPPALTATPSPIPDINRAATDSWATVAAASTAYATDPAGQSVVLTQAQATVFAIYTAYAALPTPTPIPIPSYYPSGVPIYYATPAPTAVEIVGLLGVGIVVGFIIGLLAGILLGLFIGRWRE